MKHEDLDITETTAAKADQINAVDLDEAGSVFTIAAVSRGDASAGQPVWIHMHETPGRPWKPCKTMRRLLRDCWGKRTGDWQGRAVYLYTDPAVTFGRDKTGGVRVRALSDMKAPKDLTYMVRRGQYQAFRVDVLKRREAPNLERVLEDNGLTRDQLDAWLTSVGAPIPDSPEREAECAAWIQDKTNDIRAFAGGEK